VRLQFSRAIGAHFRGFVGLDDYPPPLFFILPGLGKVFLGKFLDEAQKYFPSVDPFTSGEHLFDDLLADYTSRYLLNPAAITDWRRVKPGGRGFREVLEQRTPLFHRLVEGFWKKLQSVPSRLELLECLEAQLTP